MVPAARLRDTRRVGSDCMLLVDGFRGFHSFAYLLFVSEVARGRGEFSRDVSTHNGEGGPGDHPNNSEALENIKKASLLSE